MSLLLDENLSPRLVARLNALFPGIPCARRRPQGGRRRGNPELGLANECVVVTADGDFAAMAASTTSGPKVVHIPRCDFRLRVIEDLLRQNAIRIAAFEKESEEKLLVLQIP